MKSIVLAMLAVAALLMGSGRVQASDAAACVESTEANRELVLSFYRLALVEKQVRQAFERFVSPGFVEHKPDVPEGTREAVTDYLEALVRDLPDARWEILRTVAEGELVFLHVRFEPAPGAPAYAIADLFRISGCSIVEHWDVVGPPRDVAPNPNPRF